MIRIRLAPRRNPTLSIIKMGVYCHMETYSYTVNNHYYFSNILSIQVEMVINNKNQPDRGRSPGLLLAPDFAVPKYFLFMMFQLNKYKNGFKGKYKEQSTRSSVSIYYIPSYRHPAYYLFNPCITVITPLKNLAFLALGFVIGLKLNCI